ncbi:hypothetical protein [Desulfuribacillus alkaliarsenatis]|uniref:Type 4 fimbrial biogenesis protein PilX N-terminal domain-containing protein n=1 Tax=Desulfuribacillus alkaliarsenatis TaxID=766136 RepID=A0A1E5G588_9FIRM|nr:hypothetical protein [Desulfuribacillus alkaliarsenatis]OEF98336.1 hypothetical protein BHF68_01255 [Desulfuribacillus alkaliarsenatis]
MKCIANNKGTALFITIGVVALLMILIGSLTMALNNEIRLRMATEERVLAKYLAEAGIERAIFEIVTNDDFPNSPETINISIDDGIAGQTTGLVGQYQVSAIYMSGDESFIIFSTGVTEPTSGIRERSMSIEVIMTLAGEIIYWQEVH